MIVHLEEKRADGSTLYEVEMHDIEILMGLGAFRHLEDRDLRGRFRFVRRPKDPDDDDGDEGSLYLAENRPWEAAIWASSILYGLRLFADEGFFERLR